MTIEACADLGGFFRGLLLDAMRRRRVASDPETTEYVTGVLVTYAAPGAVEALRRPLVLGLDEALRAPRPRAANALCEVGDAALCMAGLFPAHVERSQGTLGLTVRVGRIAYREAAAAARDEGTEAPVIERLGEEFPRYVDVLAEVAEASALGAVARSVVQLYDRWKTAESERALEELCRRGVFPGRGGSGAC